MRAAATLLQTAGALTDQPELVLFPHTTNTAIELGEAVAPPAGQQQCQHNQTAAAAKAIEPKAPICTAKTGTTAGNSTTK